MTRPNQSSDLPESPATSSEMAYRFDCEFCDDALQSGTVEEVKDDGTAHLQSHRDEELSEAFAESYVGEECRNDCGHTYSVSVDEIAGFECPDCGFDHFPSFAKRYLYWQIETE